MLFDESISTVKDLGGGLLASFRRWMGAFSSSVFSVLRRASHSTLFVAVGAGLAGVLILLALKFAAVLHVLTRLADVGGNVNATGAAGAGAAGAGAAGGANGPQPVPAPAPTPNTPYGHGYERGYNHQPYDGPWGHERAADPNFQGWQQGRRDNATYSDPLGSFSKMMQQISEALAGKEARTSCDGGSKG